MKTFQLEILSPQRVFYMGECLSLVVPISDGMLGIMANHTPLTAAILDGELNFTKPDGTKIICAVMSGMVDVTDNRVRVLCESAVLPEEIDAEKEQKRVNEALMHLKNEQSHKEYIMWQLSLNKSVNRLKIKNKDIDVH